MCYSRPRVDIRLREARFRGVLIHQFVDLTEVLVCLERSANSSKLGGPDHPKLEKGEFFWELKQVHQGTGRLINGQFW